MNTDLIAVILAIMAYTFSSLGIDNSVLIAVLIAVLVFDFVGLFDALEELNE